MTTAHPGAAQRKLRRLPSDVNIHAVLHVEAGAVSTFCENGTWKFASFPRVSILTKSLPFQIQTASHLYIASIQ